VSALSITADFWDNNFYILLIYKVNLENKMNNSNYKVRYNDYVYQTLCKLHLNECSYNKCALCGDIISLMYNSNLYEK
jgi:hypothetical protein